MNNPAIYASVVQHFHGFDPDRVRPTATAADLIARSYADVRRRHARHRARDEHGRFLPASATGPVTPSTGDVVPGEVVSWIVS
jgi:hypothetical protein